MGNLSLKAREQVKTFGKGEMTARSHTLGRIKLGLGLRRFKCRVQGGREQ